MKRTIAAAVAGIMLMHTAYAANFNDVSGHWAQTEIEALSEKGIVNGVADGWFEPDGIITRAQYLKMLMETLSIETEEPREGECLDASADDWYAPYVQSVLDKGLIPESMITGYRAIVTEEEDEDGNTLSSSVAYSGAFNGNVAISREEAAYLTVCLYQYVLNASTMTSLSYDTEDIEFTDEDSIGKWALLSVKIAAANGIVTGMEDGSFEPTGTETRAQAAAMIYRLVNLMGG